MQDASIIVPLLQQNNGRGRVTIPPGDYVISSNSAAPFALLASGSGSASFGPFGLYVAGLHDLIIDAYGVNMHIADAPVNQCNWLAFYNCSRVCIQGLTFVPNETGDDGPGYGCYIMLVGMIDCQIRDIYMPGPFEHTGFCGNWLQRVLFERCVMYGAHEGYDLAYLNDVTFRECFGTGEASDADRSTSPYAMINVALDPATIAAYGDTLRPSSWLGEDVSTRVIVEPTCHARGFAGGLASINSRIS